MVTTQILDSYVEAFSITNKITPEMEAFLSGLKAIANNDVKQKSFTFNGLHYSILVPTEYYKGCNFSMKYLKFLAKSLVKKDITTVSVYDIMDISKQLFNGSAPSHMLVYLFLNTNYNDPCRHTVMKYYSLNNPK